SPAVIIGAMLISPLMGPINGMGYSLATYNFDLFRKAISNFGFAVGASLFASTLYFILSPVSTAYSEILARTSPTIYDVMIAFFGGLAGIVAVSSKLKGNVIPGVAIATALMPPLCTAGYGLATAQYNYFFGAFYLFTINTVFIAISSLLASRVFRFPIAMEVDAERKSNINRWITAVLLITILPSVYFGYLLVQNERFSENANRFINNNTVVGGSYLLRNEINPGSRSIKLVYGGNALSDNDKAMIHNHLSDFNIENSNLEIQQGFASNEKELDETQQLRNQLNATLSSLDAEKSKADSLKNLPLQGQQLYKEIKPIFPQIHSCTFANSRMYGEAHVDTFTRDLVILGVDKEALNDQEKSRIKEWIGARLNTVRPMVYFVNSTAGVDSLSVK
ncbi:MAG: DUF389 domain-containing protein, partial [Bacteroidetes bacterium]|nr:DUF389 domain-containing protein [Bacteroidota bacterium]